MLPRVPPQTALAILANTIASGTKAENAKLPYPWETATAVAEEQAANKNVSQSTWDADRIKSYVVIEDPVSTINFCFVFYFLLFYAYYL